MVVACFNLQMRSPGAACQPQVISVLNRSSNNLRHPLGQLLGRPLGRTLGRLLATSVVLGLLIAASGAQAAAADVQVPAQAGQVRGFDAAKGAWARDSVVVIFGRSTSAASGRRAIAAGPWRVLPAGPRSAVVRLRAGTSPKAAARRLAARRGVAVVKPNYRARVTAVEWTPNDPGIPGTPGGWADTQWNFAGQWGINVLPAWRKLRSLKRSGGRTATIAVIDTGVAYKSRGRYRASPDLRGVKVKSPYDFISRNKHPSDPNGHGTHVASTIFEATDNALGVTGIAYKATMIPIRALNSKGFGDEATVARAVRYAADRRANVINLSVEFDYRLTARDLPGIVSAMKYAKRKGSLIVAASGNRAAGRVAYPARSSYALAVGATTASGCLARYSNYGAGLDLVAPGGGVDTARVDASAASTDRANCSAAHPVLPIVQMNFVNDFRRFSLPEIYQGTSLAAPHVSGVAGLVVASGILGKRPTPAALQSRLQKTARDLGAPGYDRRYGHGIVDAAAAVGATNTP